MLSARSLWQYSPQWISPNAQHKNPIITSKWLQLPITSICSVVNKTGLEVSGIFYQPLHALKTNINQMLAAANLFQSFIEWTDPRRLQVLDFILKTLKLTDKHLLTFLQQSECSTRLTHWQCYQSRDWDSSSDDYGPRFTVENSANSAWQWLNSVAQSMALLRWIVNYEKINSGVQNVQYI